MNQKSVAGLLVLWAWLALVPAAAEPAKTRNVVLIVSDGLRWQEVFRGADPLLLNEQAGGSWTPVAQLRKAYWHEDPKQRRTLLLPFLWGTVAVQGQLFGNRQVGSRAEVTNRQWFSYPGYNEMASGVADARIDKNEFGPNPNETVFEWLNGLPELAGKVEIFGGWSVFHEVFNDARSHLPVRAGATVLDPGDRSTRGRLLLELYRTTTRLEGDDPFDSFVYQALRDHLKKHHPRVLFVGYGDTDNWAHAGRYDAVLDSAHHFDYFVGRLWQQMQSIPAYRDQTTFIITTDHGRGGGLTEWKEHGIAQQGSGDIWIAVIGPDTPPLGERHDVATVTQAQIAATVAAFVGQDYRKTKTAAAAPLPVGP